MSKSVRIPKRLMRTARLRAHYDVYKMALPSRDGYGANFVPGEGNVLSPVVFVGEAPGEAESRQQRPFVGKAGQLLDECFEHADINRSEVFITYVVKYRPPDNTPDMDVLVPALTLVRRELSILGPAIVVPLGASACRLWWQNPSISTLAGQCWVKNTHGHDVELHHMVMPTYHPSWALRNGKSARAQMTEHMLQIRQTMDDYKKVTRRE